MRTFSQEEFNTLMSQNQIKPTRTPLFVYLQMLRYGNLPHEFAIGPCLTWYSQDFTYVWNLNTNKISAYYCAAQMEAEEILSICPAAYTCAAIVTDYTIETKWEICDFYPWDDEEFYFQPE